MDLPFADSLQKSATTEAGLGCIQEPETPSWSHRVGGRNQVLGLSSAASQAHWPEAGLEVQSSWDSNMGCEHFNWPLNPLPHNTGPKLAFSFLKTYLFILSGFICISYMGCRGPSLGPSSIVFPGALAGWWIKVEHLGHPHGMPASQPAAWFGAVFRVPGFPHIPAVLPGFSFSMAEHTNSS